MSTMDTEYPKLLTRLHLEGNELTIRNKKVKEILNLQFSISPIYPFYDSDIRPFPWRYMYGELLWYLSQDTTVDYISKFSKFWKKLAKNDGTLQSAYGYLIFTRFNNQPSAFEFALNNLKNDIHSRQAIIRYNRPEHETYLKDFVCTMYQQFFIRNKKLISFVYMRSSDVIRGITFDIPWFSFVHQLLYTELLHEYTDLSLGPLTYTGGSVHIYEEHFDIAANAADADWKEIIEPFIISRNGFIDMKTMKPTQYVLDTKKMSTALDSNCNFKKLLFEFIGLN